MESHSIIPEERLGMFSYQYTPLDSEQRQIRLLNLLPGEPTDPIWVELETIPLEKRPQDSTYEALSYTWGATQNPAELFVGDSNERIEITRNLLDALLHLRLVDRPRIL
jgi:hypothetical protein